MTTPKNDLIEESTDPAGENIEVPDLMRSSPDAHLASDAALAMELVLEVLGQSTRA